MARKCFACARLGVGSQDGLDIYFDARATTQQLRERLLDVPQITKYSPSPSLGHPGLELDTLAYIRRPASSHSPSPNESPNENLLQPPCRPESAGPTSLGHGRQGLKQLSGSAPSMTSPATNPALTPTTCRSRQKKFLRHFNLEPEEMVIDYYSCALVADILLQGHLYISKNYFAFYSNVFGYVTKLLIPVSSVVNITKEKTAFILPNAVGVVTSDNRHVFSSLLSRDATHRLMVEVWQTAALDNVSAIEVDEEASACEESSQSGSEFDGSIATVTSTMVSSSMVKKAAGSVGKSAAGESVVESGGVARTTWLLVTCTLLLLVLSCTSALLLTRLTTPHIAPTSPPLSRSLVELQEYLDRNLNNLNKVRSSLEEVLLMMEKEHSKFTTERCEKVPSEGIISEETFGQYSTDSLLNLKEVNGS